jgi:hypothetical protein
MGELGMDTNGHEWKGLGNGSSFSIPQLEYHGRKPAYLLWKLKVGRGLWGRETGVESRGLGECGNLKLEKSEGGVGRQAEGEGVSREDAKARKVGDRPSAAVTQNVLWK